MKPWHKQGRPVDRAVQELDERIAQLQRQLRQLEHQPRSERGAPATAKVSSFVKSMLKPAPSAATPSYHARKDLFDVLGTPLKDLEAEPIGFGPRAVEPDLFTGSTGAAPPERPGPKEEKLASNDSRLARYLGAGSIRTYKPTKSIQRRDRNRFLAWLGLAVAALWVIYVVIR